MVEARPFVKWAGGKKQLLPELAAAIPAKFNSYHEPFVGGGALLFSLYNKGLLNKFYIYDYNDELTNAYRVVKSNVNALVSELSSDYYQPSEKRFYEIRQSSPDDRVKRAARFIYLNKTAFNGLYRVNSRGWFNVPFGKYKNPRILDEDNLRAVSAALQKDEIITGDFTEVLNHAKKGDFVYFDPPYNPLSKTSSFTSYTADDFSEEDHVRLAETVKILDKRGCHVVVSNSETPFIKELYRDYQITTVTARRMINCKGDGRGKINELLISNLATDKIVASSYA